MHVLHHFKAASLPLQVGVPASQTVAECIAVCSCSCACLLMCQVFIVCRYVSKPAAGGRGAADRQFFFVNRRPVDLPKVYLPGVAGPCQQNVLHA